MSGRLRARRSEAGEATTQEKTYEIPGLEFYDTLSWRAGKAIPVADLLDRLQKLNTQLRNLDQDQIESRQFTTLAQDLANASLLGHKDKGIRAWTVSCIVDVLKACAPDAPFKDTHLKDIFTVIINSIIPALADPSNAYNSQHIYILNSLAESQSILLLTDIPQPDALICALFTHCFDVVSATADNGAGIDISKSVEYHLKNILCEVVEEIALPQDVTDIIISQFMRVDARNNRHSNYKAKKQRAQDDKQGTLLLKDYPPAYNMAKSICTTCSDKMTAQITQYFGAVIVDASATIQANGDAKPARKRASDSDDSEDEQEELADLQKAHRLVRELWRACPDVLVNVIPQIEAELSADSERLRQLATETLGDLAAGIGLSGITNTSGIDPTIYPLPSVTNPEQESEAMNPLLTPASPKPFTTVYATAYQSFSRRRNDKAHAVRLAWVSAAIRILFTAAGGIGLNEAEQTDLLAGLAQMLRDYEERVRLKAIQEMSIFTYHGCANILGADGGLSKEGTVFATLAERVTDRKAQIRDEAITLLARVWGVASRDIEEGNERIVAIFGDIPSKLFGAYYVNDASIHAALDKVMFESLVPLSFPPVKPQSGKPEGRKQKGRGRGTDDTEAVVSDPDAIRARRILNLVRGLDARSKQVFFGIQGRQAQLQTAVTAFLKMCEDYNGGVIEDSATEDKIKTRLSTYIEALSKPFPDASKMAADLWKFAKLHNRRDYQLIRFAMGIENDYRTMHKAIKELTKRIKEGPTNTQSLIDSLLPLLYRCALIVYNRSHVPAIMVVSRTDENGLADVAHEVLKDISIRNPGVLKTQIQALCKELEDSAPSTTNFEELGAADTLKACAGFARKYPSDVSKDRKFLTALTNFALFSKSPRAAKNAVTIVLTVANSKEMYAKDMFSKALKDCQYQSPYFLSRLATIAQICLLAPSTIGTDTDPLTKLTFTDTLYVNRSSSTEKDDEAWNSSPDDETIAKELALKILVNVCRSDVEDSIPENSSISTKHVINTLMQLCKNDGEITPTRNTPTAQRNRLRLLGAKLIMKLCGHKKGFEELINPVMFQQIAMIVINHPSAVRSGFVQQVKKYLGQNQLNHRWYTTLYLLAFEPDTEVRNSTIVWLKSRRQYFARHQQAKSGDKKPHQNILESTFSRLLSLLAHHPDYPNKETEEYETDLLDFSRYIIFYLISASTEDNLSLIFHIAQRVKQTRDAVEESEIFNERLYVLSDLAQAVIRNYADQMPAHKGANLLQTWPGTVSLPKSLFKALPGHEIAQQIAEKNYLPEDTASGLEKLIKAYIKSTKPGSQSIRRYVANDKKRKSGSVESEDEERERKRIVKKAKKTSLPLRRTPKTKRTSTDLPSSELPIRKSARTSGVATVTYAEGDSDDDDAEMEEYEKAASSPAKSRRTKNLSSPTERKTVAEVAEENLTSPVNGNEAAEEEKEIDDEDEVEDANGLAQVDGSSDRDPSPSPSPLKKKSNKTPNKLKANMKKTPTKQATKEKTESVRATRSSARTKS